MGKKFSKSYLTFMKIRKNKVKAFFREGKTTFGIWNDIANASVAEICAGAGFDWVVIDAEHSPYELSSILASSQAMANHDAGIIVRPPSDDPVFIKKLLDIGIQTFLVPLVETVAQAQELVRAISYPPKGIRGVAASIVRASQWNRVPDYLDQVQEELCLIVQVETVEGMRNIEAICQVEGVDGVFIGPSDLAASMGLLGQPLHEGVKAEVKRGLKIIKRSGKVPGVLALRDDIVQEYLAAGASFIGVGVDLMLLVGGMEDLVGRYKS